MKSRLTITLSTDILKKIDRLIDGKKVRNRSHAIEQLVSTTLMPTVNTAVILAGGVKKGKTPVPLARINGRSLLGVTLEHLKVYGIKDFIICAGQFEKEIQKKFGNGSPLGIKIRYIHEPKPLGTAGVLKKVRPFLGSEPFLVIHGDVLTNLNIADFIAFHESENTQATIAVKPRLAEENFGKVLLNGNKITEFISKTTDKGLGIVNTGIYIFEPEIFELITDTDPTTLEKDVFPRLAKMGELSAFFFQGIWYDVSRKSNFQKARNRWRKMQHKAN